MENDWQQFLKKSDLYLYDPAVALLDICPK